jgi:CheY-like chemotaxis protein
VGSSFTFSARFGLPAFTPHGQDRLDMMQQQAALQQAKVSLHGAHLLLVEDNAMNRELALEILANAGIRADVACNGAEAVEMVSRTSYDAVLMDCQMPVMDGFDATQSIRAVARFADLPIIAMTANAMAEDREKCVASGMNDHIAKPLHTRNLFATLARWVKPALSGAVASSPSSADAPDSKTGSSPTESAVPGLTGVDAAEALDCIDGNPVLYRKILNSFREEQADAVEHMRTACRTGERQTAVRLAHTLRGLAANVGAQGIVAMAKEIESALKNERDDLAETLLTQLEGPLAELVHEIERAMPTLDRESPSVEATDASPDRT